MTYFKQLIGVSLMLSAISSSVMADSRADQKNEVRSQQFIAQTSKQSESSSVDREEPMHMAQYGWIKRLDGESALDFKRRTVGN